MVFVCDLQTLNFDPQVEEMPHFFFAYSMIGDFLFSQTVEQVGPLPSVVCQFNHCFTHSHARAHTHTHTEACKLQPSVIEVVQKNKAMMVRKVARRHSEAPLHG